MDYFIKVNIVLALFYGLYCLVFRRSAYFAVNRAFLLTGLGLAFIVPALNVFPGGSVSPFPEISFSELALPELFSSEALPKGTAAQDFQQVGAVQQPGEAAAVLEPISISAEGSPATSPGWLYWGTFIYRAVAGFFLLKIFFFLFQLLRRYRKNRVIRRNGCRLVILNDPDEPAFSFFSTIFISASDLRRNNWILRHELLHVQQVHSLDILLSELVKAVLWVNPIAHLYQHALREVHEYQADAIVPQAEKGHYAKLLYDYSFQGGQLSLQNSFFNKTHLKRRIHMLYQKKSPKMRAAYLLVLPLLGLLVAFTANRHEGSSETDRFAEQAATPSTGTDAQVANAERPAALITVSGKVTDLSNKPLAGVSIFVEGTPGGTATDREGQFKLSNVPAQGTLRFKMIGYETQLINLNNNSTVNLSLQRKKERLKDIMLVAYAAKDAERETQEPDSGQPEAANTPAEKVYSFASLEKMPEFPGGTQGLLHTFAKEFNYPAKARDNNVEGLIEIGFIVDKEGRVTHPEILKGIGSGCDEEALRVAKTLPKWAPGEQNGTKVPVYYVLPLYLKVD